MRPMPSQAPRLASRAAAALLIVLSITGCVTAPTQGEIDAADVGQAPEFESARDAAEALLLARIGEHEPNKHETNRMLQVDAQSAEIHWEPLVRRGWYELDSSVCFGWQLDASVNARNEQGELTGWERWSYWFRYGSLVASAEPSRMGKPGCAVELSTPILLRKSAAAADPLDSSRVKRAW
jgi:hypothetical protein